MESVQYFHPTLNDPATAGIPFCAYEDPEEADDAEPAPGDEAREEQNVDAGCCRASALPKRTLTQSFS